MTGNPDRKEPEKGENVLVLVRHGESEWNRLNRFTGWKDVGLTEEGSAEAHRAGAMLKAAGYRYVTLDLEGLRSGNLNNALRINAG